MTMVRVMFITPEKEVIKTFLHYSQIMGIAKGEASLSDYKTMLNNTKEFEDERVCQAPALIVDIQDLIIYATNQGDTLFFGKNDWVWEDYDIKRVCEKGESWFIEKDDKNE